jgi:DNA recombination protein RmuC
LRAHARHLRRHVDQLSAKAYWQRFAPTPEFVVCFVPADAFLDAALRADPTLLEHAFRHDVVIATPSTLVALLRTIAFTWRQKSVADNAEAVLALGRDLYQRLATMGAHIDKLGRSLGSAVTAYNETVGSLERRVMSTARQMSELGVVPASERLVAGPVLHDSTPRPLTAVELTDPRVVAWRRAGAGSAGFPDDKRGADREEGA